MVVHGAEIGKISYETDRLRFIGRGHTKLPTRKRNSLVPFPLMMEECGGRTSKYKLIADFRSRALKNLQIPDNDIFIIL